MIDSIPLLIILTIIYLIAYIVLRRVKVGYVFAAVISTALCVTLIYAILRSPYLPWTDCNSVCSGELCSDHCNSVKILSTYSVFLTAAVIVLETLSGLIRKNKASTEKK